MNQISAKQDFPKSGAPLYYEGLFTGFYFVTFKSYMAFYKVETDRLLVSRVVYGKSDYMRTIFRKENARGQSIQSQPAKKSRLTQKN